MTGTIKFTAALGLRGEALRRVKELLRGAPKRIAAHRVSVGINEQEASAQAVKPGSRKPKTNKLKKNYKGSETGAYLIDIMLGHEFGTARLPERSWLRSWFDRNLDRLKQESVEAMRAEYTGDADAVPALAARWQDDLKKWIADGGAGLLPLAPATVKQRQAAGLPEGPPLYATHQFVDAIRAIADGRYV